MGNVGNLTRVLEVAKNHLETIIEFGIRPNMDIGQDYASKFGIDATEELLNEIIRFVSNVANLKLAGDSFSPW